MAIKKYLGKLPGSQTLWTWNANANEDQIAFFAWVCKFWFLQSIKNWVF